MRPLPFCVQLVAACGSLPAVPKDDDDRDDAGMLDECDAPGGDAADSGDGDEAAFGALGFAPAQQAAGQLRQRVGAAVSRGGEGGGGGATAPSGARVARGGEVPRGGGGGQGRGQGGRMMSSTEAAAGRERQIADDITDELSDMAAQLKASGLQMNATLKKQGKVRVLVGRPSSWFVIDGRTAANA